MTNYDILKEYETHKTPVPTYEEWKKAYEYVVSENEEITTLKYLLRKAKGIIKAYHLTGNQNIYSDNDMKGCIAQIEQALGEDE